jgi:hypothetical protein
MSDSHVLQENSPIVSAVSPVQHVFLPCHFSSRDASLPYRLPNRSIPSLVSQTLVLTCSVYPALGSLETMNPPIPLPTIYHTKERTCLEDSILNSLAHHALTYALTPKPTHPSFLELYRFSSLSRHPPGCANFFLFRLPPSPNKVIGFPYPPTDHRDTSPKTAIGESSGHHRLCHLDIPYRASTSHWDSLRESLPFLFMSETELGPLIRQVVMDILDK